MKLPAPPTEKEVWLYLEPRKAFLYGFSIISTALLFTGGFLFAYNKPQFAWFFAFTCFTSFYLGLGYLIGLISKGFNFKFHYHVIKSYYKPTSYTVDIFLPSCGEDLAILENTYRAVSDLESPTVKVYVLDDSFNINVMKLSEKYQFEYITRLDLGHLKKSGNVRNAFSKTSGDFIVIFDADFCPRPDFLKHTIPYFLYNQNIAIVQTAQFFDVDQKQSWIEKGSGGIQELFYRLIQVNRDHFGGAICVGTNAVYRRKALEPLGGTYPIGHSEDVHTGFWCLKEKWQVKYLPINLAKGLCPDNIAGFFMQQYRWCIGSTTLFLNWSLFWKAKITLWQRLCYLSGMLYYQATALSIILNPIPGLLMLWFYPQDVHWFNLAFSIPSFLFGTVHMSLWNKQPYGMAAIRTRVVSYYAHFFAIKDKIFGSVAPWIPTGIVTKNDQIRRFKRLLLAINGGVIILAAIGLSRNMTSWDNYNFYPWILITGFFTAVNLSCLKEKTSDHS